LYGSRIFFTGSHAHRVNHWTKKGSTVFLSLLSWPRLPHRIVDIDRNIFVIGYPYYCGHEVCGTTYQSWLQQF
jgi:hypothetical protein